MGSKDMTEAHCMTCHELIHLDNGLWYHGIHRRECNPPFYQPLPKGARPLAYPDHTHEWVWEDYMADWVCITPGHISRKQNGAIK